MLISFLANPSTLKNETCSSKTSVDFQQTTWRYICVRVLSILTYIIYPHTILQCLDFILILGFITTFISVASVIRTHC
jgi:hypothetical protein